MRNWSLFRGAAATLVMSAGVFLLVAGMGAAVTSFVGEYPEAPDAGDTRPISDARSGPDGEMLARLADYTRSIGMQERTPTPPAGELLPDVETMVERLAARLETSPDDTKGWRMLGWTYFQMARYEQAAAAYAKALELDANSAELKLSYEEAKAKASNGAIEHAGDGVKAEEPTKSEVGPLREHDAAIRSMVDRLADRLERSPRDVEGWSSLLRSRVVLGESELATTAFRRALDVFKDDPDASSKITAAALELGLQAN
jgi:cytochrome c-type biogenesis protein CcmH/NrfG